MLVGRGGTCDRAVRWMCLTHLLCQRTNLLCRRTSTRSYLNRGLSLAYALAAG